MTPDAVAAANNKDGPHGQRGFSACFCILLSDSRVQPHDGSNVRRARFPPFCWTSSMGLMKHWIAVIMMAMAMLLVCMLIPMLTKLLVRRG